MSASGWLIVTVACGLLPGLAGHGMQENFYEPHFDQSPVAKRRLFQLGT